MSYLSGSLYFKCPVCESLSLYSSETDSIINMSRVISILCSCTNRPVLLILFLQAQLDQQCKQHYSIRKYDKILHAVAEPTFNWILLSVLHLIKSFCICADLLHTFPFRSQRCVIYTLNMKKTNRKKTKNQTVRLPSDIFRELLPRFTFSLSIIRGSIV